MAETGASCSRRFLHGERISLEAFVAAYSDSLVRFAYSILRSAPAAEDVAAEAIAILFAKPRHFPDEARLRAYLYKTVRSKAMDYLRRHKNETPLEDLENVLGGGDPAQSLLKKERDAAVYACLQRLPEQYRQVLVLTYFEDFSVREVCAITKLSSKQVYNLLTRARSSLKRELEKEGISNEDL